jgi:glycosyltransferase involved in cell wall biosynthesis
VGVEWHAPIGCDNTGFFFEALTYVLALDRRGVPVSIAVGKCPQATLDLLLPADAAILLKAQAAASKPLPAKQIVSVYHSKICEAGSQPAKARGVSKVIVRTMTEAKSVPDTELKCLRENHIDQLWLPSQWHREVYAHAGAPANKLAIVAEAVDTSVFHSGPPTGPSPRGQLDGFCGDEIEASPVKPFVFVSVFKWEHRKGWDVLLEAFFHAFSRKDNVILKLRAYKPGWEQGNPDLMVQITDAAKQFIKVYASDRTLADLPRVEWIDHVLTQKELRNLYATSSAFVLPTRGEGWGLPVVEAMAVGLPVICTNASGPTAYLTKENSFQLAFTHISKAVPNVVMTHNKIVKFQTYSEDDGLVEPSSEKLQVLMRKVYDDPKRAAEVGAVASADIGKRFAPSAIADAMLSQIHHLL